MKVFVAGATGVLGRALVRQLVVRGHQVTGLARDAKGEQSIKSLGGESRASNIFDANELARAADGAEVLIHAATAISTKMRPKPRDWEMNDRLRCEGTRALTECAGRVGARLYLQQSIVWLARPADGSFFDEDSAAFPDAITQSALDGEEMVTEFASRLGAARPRHLPAWLARIFAGNNVVSFFTTSTHTSNARFRRDFDWSPRYPSYREGLAQVVGAWQAGKGVAKNG